MWVDRFLTTSALLEVGDEEVIRSDSLDRMTLELE